MKKKMLVESDPHETRIAVFENDQLTEVFVERHQQLGLVGNIYKGRVNRVLPGMQAAFVDIGLERDAFLYVDEVVDPLASYRDFEVGETDSVELPRSLMRPSIDSLLETGQHLIVQVLKDALPNKGARVSTQITLPGRYLVVLPNVPHLGVSRRIEDEDERERLRGLLDEIRPANTGLIARTAAEGGGRDELLADLEILTKLWDRIQSRGQKVAPPTLLHRDLDLALRIVRDYMTEDFTDLWVEGEEVHERIVEFLEGVQPDLVSKVQLFDRESALFEHFDIEPEIEGALKTKVWLKSGGHIVINPTEALVAIDVNTGRYVGRHNLEDTVLTTNLEAVREIVRQIRLRNLGGIIVIDLIDMVDPEHRDQVFSVLEGELAKDRSKNKVLSISEFGLVEITRKRSRPSLERQLTQPCPYCNGTGRIRSIETVCLDLRRRVLRRARRLRGREVLLRVHPDVAQALQQEDRQVLDELERALETEILIQSDPKLHHENFDVLEV